VTLAYIFCAGGCLAEGHVRFQQAVYQADRADRVLRRVATGCVNDLSENVRRKNNDDNHGDDSADDPSIETSVAHERPRYCKFERIL